MCRSVPSYALPKRVLNKEGVYKTVAADPDTKLVEDLHQHVKDLGRENRSMTSTPMKREGWKLTADGQDAVDNGSPEYRVFMFVQGRAGATAGLHTIRQQLT